MPRFIVRFRSYLLRLALSSFALCSFTRARISIHFGAWLSLVERTVRDREVGGSNPLAPTIIINNIKRVATKWWLFLCVAALSQRFSDVDDSEQSSSVAIG